MTGASGRRFTKGGILQDIISTFFFFFFFNLSLKIKTVNFFHQALWQDGFFAITGNYGGGRKRSESRKAQTPSTCPQDCKLPPQHHTGSAPCFSLVQAAHTCPLGPVQQRGKPGERRKGDERKQFSRQCAVVSCASRTGQEPGPWGRRLLHTLSDACSAPFPSCCLHSPCLESLPARGASTATHEQGLQPPRLASELETPGQWPWH